MLAASLLALATSTALPNFLLIVTDDQGWGDLSCYGGDIPTPNIDRIAEEGTRFTDFYVTAPVCTPSRFSMLSGRQPWKAKSGLGDVGMMLDKSHQSHAFAKDEIIIPELLKTKGYSTALFGKWHLGHGDQTSWPLAQGFDQFYGALGGCVDFFTHKYGFVHDWYRNNEPSFDQGYTTQLITDEAIKYL